MAFYVFPKTKIIRSQERLRDDLGIPLRDHDGHPLLATVEKKVRCWLWWCWDI
jgi:hypothetical protein